MPETVCKWEKITLLVFGEVIIPATQPPCLSNMTQTTQDFIIGGEKKYFRIERNWFPTSWPPAIRMGTTMPLGRFLHVSFDGQRLYSAISFYEELYKTDGIAPNCTVKWVNVTATNCNECWKDTVGGKSTSLQSCRAQLSKSRVTIFLA